MNRNAIVHKFESTLNFLRNQRVVIISLVGAAATIFPLLGARLSNNSYLDSLGRTAVAHQPSAVPRDNEWSAEFNKKYDKGIRCDSFSHVVPKNQPLQTLVPLDIRQEEATQALVKEVLETAQKMGLAPETSENSLNNSLEKQGNALETSESSLNDSLEKQGNKTQRYGVSVGIGPTVNGNLNFQNNQGTIQGLERARTNMSTIRNTLQSEIARANVILAELEETHIADLNNTLEAKATEINRMRSRRGASPLDPCQLQWTPFGEIDDPENSSGLTKVDLTTNPNGEVISEATHLTLQEFERLLQEYRFSPTKLDIGIKAAQKRLRFGRGIATCINNHQTLTARIDSLTQQIESIPSIQWDFKASTSPAVVQVYTSLPVTKAQGSLSLDLKSKELCVGVGKSHFLAGKNSRLGFLVGADAHARVKVAPNPGFGGFGLKVFAGPVVSF